MYRDVLKVSDAEYDGAEGGRAYRHRIRRVRALVQPAALEVVRMGIYPEDTGFAALWRNVSLTSLEDERRAEDDRSWPAGP